MPTCALAAVIAAASSPRSMRAGYPGSSQRTNAYAYARTGAATVMEESNLRDGLLAAEIMRIMDDQAVYAEMAEAAQGFAPRDAAEKIARILSTIGEEHA